MSPDVESKEVLAPKFLVILCKLSFAMAILRFSYMVLRVFLAGGITFFASIIKNVDNAFVTEIGYMWADIAISGTLIITGLIGVILMWNLQRKGYYIYAVSNVTVLILDVFQTDQLSIVLSILVVVMLILYGFNLKHMKQ